jgi:septum formation inhibitor MinC
MPHRHPIAIGAVVTVLLTGLQLPLAAGTPTKAKAPEHPHERFDPLHRHRLRGGDPKVKFGGGDAWVAKYKVGPNGATQVLWKKQLGTSTFDYSGSVATDSQGNIFISGATEGALAGSNKGDDDAWVAKYSSEGTLLWTKQLGTSASDISWGVATDSQGNVFISGYTGGALAGSNKGEFDAWVAKYSPEGTLLWTKQLGTSDYDYSLGVSTDSQGNVFISGYTGGALAGSNKGGDAWVAKYSSKGTLLWTKQLGSSDYDYSLGVSTDSQGNVFISGFTYGALAGGNKGSSDAWVAKYSPEGTLRWRKQLGSSDTDDSLGVATDSRGNVFISGATDGALAGSNKGFYDAWVAKYSPEGTLLWTKQLGSSDYDDSNGVATDSQGNVFISGYTEGALKGSNRGGFDAWVAKYSPNGKLWWLRQEGTRRSDSAIGVATDSNGHVLVTGYTEGNLGD